MYWKYVDKINKWGIKWLLSFPSGYFQVLMLIAFIKNKKCRTAPALLYILKSSFGLINNIMCLIEVPYFQNLNIDYISIYSIETIDTT